MGEDIVWDSAPLQCSSCMPGVLELSRLIIALIKAIPPKCQVIWAQPDPARITQTDASNELGYHIIRSYMTYAQLDAIMFYFYGAMSIRSRIPAEPLSPLSVSLRSMEILRTWNRPLVRQP